MKTYYPKVADQCLKNGAEIINKTGSDPDIYRRVAKYNAAVIICYVQGENPHLVSSLDEDLDQIYQEKLSYFEKEIDTAKRNGVKPNMVRSRSRLILPKYDRRNKKGAVSNE